MLSDNKLALLKELVKQANREEIIWTKGYLTGYLEGSLGSTNVVPEQIAVPLQVKPLIVYGTETGNAKKVGTQLLANLKKEKTQAKLTDVFQLDINKLKKEKVALFIVSTQGDGEFPINANEFYETLKASTIDLSELQFAVFGLGDSSYPLFCQAGILLDEVLEQKGAKRLLPLVKADVDYADLVTRWESDIKKALSGNTAVSAQPVVVQSNVSTSHKKNFTGIISHKVVLNDTGSNKETYHIEITPNEEIVYEPGDAIGFYPKNDENELRKIAAILGDESQYELFKTKNVRGLSKKNLEKLAEAFQIEIAEEKADLLHILGHYKIAKINPEAVADLLHQIAPRLYSIASDVNAHDGEVHIAVTLSTFYVSEIQKTGHCSQFLADLPKGTEIDFYIHKNNNFRLPSHDTDIIMIGPGTGVAPFRSFLAHRDEEAAEGRNWLFFGEQHFVLDFYYQTEIQEWIASGILTRFDAAFSRDQERKIYVQDRIKEKAKEFNEWLENGASIYVCGQKNPMSKDVENTILDVISSERKVNLEEAKAILEQMELDGKYQKDVY